jgi:hypothetical protein
MPIGYHRSSKPQKWNGSGMTSLSVKRRKEIAQAASDAMKKRTNGWPKSIQKEGVPDTYLLADAEWAKRMANSKMRRAKT